MLFVDATGRARRALAVALFCLPAGLLIAAPRRAPIRQGDTALLGRRTFARNPDVIAKFKRYRDAGAPRSRFLSMRAKRRADDAEMFLEGPLDLGGSFRVEVEVGLFRRTRLAGLADAYFGIEVRNVDDESEFYATYVEYDEATSGLRAFAMTADGQQGDPVLFPNADRLDLAIDSTGSSMTFGARRPAAFGPFATLGSAPVESPAAAFRGCVGASEFDRRTEVGATNLVVVRNSGPPSTLKSASGEARQAFFSGCGWVLQTGRVINRPPFSDLTEQQVAFTLDQARFDFDDAKQLVEGLDIPQRRAALRQIQRAINECGYAEGVIVRRKARGVPAAKRILHQHIWGAAFQIARLLPED